MYTILFRSKMSIELIKVFYKRNILKIFEHEGIFIFIFLNNKGIRKSQFQSYSIFILKKNKLKEFGNFMNEHSSINQSYEQMNYIIFTSISDIQLRYDKILQKLYIKETKNNNIIEHKYLAITSEKKINYLISNIKKVSFLKLNYLFSQIFKYNNMFAILYQDSQLDYEYFRVVLYENNIKQQTFLSSFNQSNKIVYNEYFSHKYVYKFYQILLYEEYEMKKINMLDIDVPNNIINEIESHKESNLRKTKKLSEWINYYKKNNFVFFEYYDIKIIYQRKIY